MRYCEKCVLNENFPRIKFDDNGVCNLCRDSQDTDRQAKQIKRYEQKFLTIIENLEVKSDYDCLVAFSGGKDSSYTMSLLKNKYGLHPLAFSFDNWFTISARATKYQKCGKVFKNRSYNNPPGF